jgi:transposase
VHELGPARLPEDFQAESSLCTSYATHACTHPAYRDRYQRLKTRVGKQRGAKVAQVDLARRLAEAIWHMLTRDQPFAPAGATDPLAA